MRRLSTELFSLTLIAGLAVAPCVAQKDRRANAGSSPARIAAELSPNGSASRRVEIPTTRPASARGFAYRKNPAFIVPQLPIQKALTAAGNLPKIYGSVIYSDDVYRSRGLYDIPLAAGDPFTMLIKGPNANYGGVLKDGIYYATNYGSNSGGATTIVNGYDIKTGQVVYTWSSDRTVGPVIAMGLDLDPVTDEIYGIVYTEEVDGMMLAKIVYNKTPESTKIADLEGTWNTFMIDADGQFYGIRKEYDYIDGIKYLVGSTLCKIDRDNGAVTEVGRTGKYPAYLSGGCIDRTTGRMFWAVSDNESGFICEIDKTTGEATTLYTFPDGEEVSGMFVPEDAAAAKAPAAVSGLKASFPEGTLSGTVSCTAPMTLFDGSAATGNVTIHVQANGAEVATSTVAYGSIASIPVTLTKAGYYNFLVYAENSAGRGPKERIEDYYIGNDTPEATTVSLERKDGKMIVSWLPVTTSVNDGYINPSEVTYNVVRYPDSIRVAEGIKGTVFEETLEEPDHQTAYSYGVTAEFDGLVSAEAISNAISLGVIIPPYKADFSSATGFTGFTVIDANNDGYTWERNETYGFARIRWNSTLDMDDWLITPPVSLKAGESYEVSFPSYASAVVHPERLEVKWGAEPTVEGMTFTAVEPTDIKNGLADDPVIISAFITPPEDGIYYVGVHGISPKDMSALWVGDISISAPMSAYTPGPATDLLVTPDPDGKLEAELTFNAPSVTMGESELSELTRIEVLNSKEEVIKTFENPEPGSHLTCFVKEDAAGVYSYSVVAYNSYGAGVAATVSSHIGMDKPAVPENVSMTATSNEGEVTIVWDEVSTDCNGNKINPARVTYSVYRIKGGQNVPVADDLTGTSYTFQAVAAGEQDFVQCAVFAHTDGGYGAGALTEMLPVGKPYNGMTESFGGGRTSYIWGVNTEGGGSWGIFTDKASLSAQDGDNGFLGMTGTGSGDNASIFSGFISLKGMDKPGLTFYTFNMMGEAGTPDNNIIRVSVRVEGGEYEEVLAGTVQDLCNATSGWGKVTLELEAYADKVIQVKFYAEAINFAYVLFDNIRVAPLLDNDLRAFDISAPASVETGKTFKVNVTVQNVGMAKASDYNVDLYADGELVESKQVEAILPEERIVTEFDCVMSPVATEAVSYYAEIRYDLDGNTEDNRTETVTVMPKLSLLPVVEDLEAICGDGEVSLIWSEPSSAAMKGKPVTDDFEDAEAFSDKYGNWIFADRDDAAVGGFQETEMPGITPGESKGSFWIWDQSQVGNGSFAAHSGYKYLFSMYRADEGQADDWAISPALDGMEQTISFYARSYDGGYPEEIEIYYSMGGTDYKDFVKIEGAGGEVPGEWTLYKAKLPKGAKRFAIRSCAVYAFMLMVDDVTYIPEVRSDYELTGFNVYRDGLKINGTLLEETEFADTEVTEDTTYSYVVTAVYTDGESAGSNVVTLLYKRNSLDGVGEVVTSVRVRDGHIEISNPSGAEIIVMTPEGQIVYDIRGRKSAILDVRAGVYVVKAGDLTRKVIVR